MPTATSYSPSAFLLMTRHSRKKLQSTSAAAQAPRQLILVAEAARQCGWRRANTFRERFLVTDADAVAMGLAYDEHGRAVVDAAAVAAAALQVAREKAARAPNWRVRNLGAHAQRRSKALDVSESVGHHLSQSTAD